MNVFLLQFVVSGSLAVASGRRASVRLVSFFFRCFLNQQLPRPEVYDLISILLLAQWFWIPWFLFSLQVWASLLTNAFSALLGLAGVVYDCVLLSTVPSDMFCKSPSQTRPLLHDEWTRKCFRNLWALNVSPDVSLWFCYFLLGVTAPFFTPSSRFSMEFWASSWFCWSCRSASASPSAFSLDEPSDATNVPLR